MSILRPLVPWPAPARSSDLFTQGWTIAPHPLSMPRGRESILSELVGYPKIAHQGHLLERQEEGRPPRVALERPRKRGHPPQGRVVVVGSGFRGFRFARTIGGPPGLCYTFFLVRPVFGHSGGSRGADGLVIALGVGGDGLHDLELDIAAQLDCRCRGRPMFVAIVIAPSLPASAMICILIHAGAAFRMLLGQTRLFQQLAPASRISRSRWCRPARAAPFRGTLGGGFDDGLVFLARGANRRRRRRLAVQPARSWGSRSHAKAVRSP